MENLQMIREPWGVACYGAADVKGAPDLVKIVFKVIRLEQSPATAFDQAGRAVAAVQQVLREHRVADSGVDGSRLTLRSKWEYRNSAREFAGYECQAAFAVTSTDLDDVQQLLIDLVDAGAHEIEQVEYDLHDKPAARDRARAAAIAAARRKAKVYAEAAGVRLGSIKHIEDVDPEQDCDTLHRGHQMGGAQVSEVDLAPGHVVVHAAVVVGFSLLPN